MDRNGDGRVSTGEFEDVARAMFDAMDGDKDDNVSVQEMEAARQRIAGRVAIGSTAAARRIRDLDVNGDGVLSRTEHRDAATRLFQDADLDDDGNLTTQEFETRYAEVVASLAP
jgi:Ca2+-binding EF-hand superfamily protein